MSYDDYNYDYHDLADNADDLYDDYELSNEGDDSWNGTDEDENDIMDDVAWDNYYHNIADELDDE